MQAMEWGKPKVAVPVDSIADILDYLNPNDATQSKSNKPFLDDQPTPIIEHFIHMKEKDNGPIF
jgi:hypothetical protein